MHLTWSERGRNDEGCELVRLSCRSGALLGVHDHEYPELFWVEEGVCTHLVAGTRSDLPAGSLVFIRASDLHQLRADTAPFIVCNVTLNPGWAAALAARHPEHWEWAWPTQGLPRVLNLDVRAQAQLRTWFEALWQEVPDRLVTEGFVLDVLRLVRPHRSAQRDPGPAWLREALGRLRDPEVFRDGVPALARIAGVSREHLARACRRFRQRSPGDLVAEARLDFARRLLLHGELDITSVAAACGFGGPAQFYRRFVARYGCPPAAWRRRETQAP